MEGKLPIRAQVLLEKINVRGGKADSERELLRLFPDWSLPTISASVKMLASITLIEIEQKKAGTNITRNSISITEKGRAYIKVQKQADNLLKKRSSDA